MLKSLQQWRMCESLGVQINEVAKRSTSRLLAKMNTSNPDLVSVIISACRDGEPIYQYLGPTKKYGLERRRINRRPRNAQDDLKDRLRALGYGVVDTTGGYKEKQDGREYNVEEPSVLASKKMTGTRQEEVRSIVALACKTREQGGFGQDGVIIKFPGEQAHEYKADDDDYAGADMRYPYRDPTIQNDPMYYTKLNRGLSKDTRKLTYPDAFTDDPGEFDPATGEIK